MQHNQHTRDLAAEPDYATRAGLRSYMFTLGVVFAPDYDAAAAFADAHGLRGTAAHEAHTQLGREAGWWL